MKQNKDTLNMHERERERSKLPFYKLIVHACLCAFVWLSVCFVCMFVHICLFVCLCLSIFGSVS